MPRKKKDVSTGPVIMTLTEEDLAEARRRKGLHDKKARELASEHMKHEFRMKEMGEVSELTVPQIAEYDMSAAFTKAAMGKALRAGFADIANLRKTTQGWVFECLTVPQARDMRKLRLTQTGRAYDEAATQL